MIVSEMTNVIELIPKRFLYSMGKGAPGPLHIITHSGGSKYGGGMIFYQTSCSKAMVGIQVTDPNKVDIRKICNLCRSQHPIAGVLAELEDHQRTIAGEASRSDLSAEVIHQRQSERRDALKRFMETYRIPGSIDGEVLRTIYRGRPVTIRIKMEWEK